jgi:hypothetical protein
MGETAPKKSKKDKKDKDKDKEKPKKRKQAAAVPEEDTLQISFDVRDDKEGPVLCSFPGGVPPLEHAKFQLFKNTNTRKAHQRLLLTENSEWSCVGRNFGGGSFVAPGAGQHPN